MLLFIFLLLQVTVDDNDTVRIHDDDDDVTRDPPVTSHVTSCDMQESVYEHITTSDDVIQDNEAGTSQINKDKADILQDKDGSHEEVISADVQVMSEKDGEKEYTSSVEPITVPDDAAALPQYRTDVASLVQDIAVSDTIIKPHPPSAECDSFSIENMESIYLDFEALNDMVTMTTDAVSEINQEGESNLATVPTISPQ